MRFTLSATLPASARLGLAANAQQQAQEPAQASAQPVAPNAHADGSDNPDGRAENRRVEIIVNKTKRPGE